MSAPAVPTSRLTVMHAILCSETLAGRGRPSCSAAMYADRCRGIAVRQSNIWRLPGSERSPSSTMSGQPFQPATTDALLMKKSAAIKPVSPQKG